MKRSEEITQAYFQFLDKHLADIVYGRESDADGLSITRAHLSDTIQQTMGHHPCHFCDRKILEEAMKLLEGKEICLFLT